MSINIKVPGILADNYDKKTTIVFNTELVLKKILVTGCNGQLGRELRKIAPKYENFIFDFKSSKDLDITDNNAVLSYCKQEKPQYIINCAAYTAVDKAEEDIENCYKVNRDAIQHIAKAANLIKAKVIHISTDYVYDGKKQTPYSEQDKVDPISIYGKSKLAGEKELNENCLDFVIIRTAWLYSSYGNNFVKTMLKLGHEKKEINVINDQIGTPTYAEDLALTIMDIIIASEKDKFVTGIYNYTNEGSCSWFDFAVKIHAFAEIKNCEIKPIETKDYPTLATRPSYSILNKNKIKTTYGITIPTWEESLKKCINLLK